MSIPWITEELPRGRYYSRWVEVSDLSGYQLRCNCGFASEWQPSRDDILLWADEIHRRH